MSNDRNLPTLPEILPPEGNPIPISFPSGQHSDVERMVDEMQRAINEIDRVHNGTAKVKITWGYAVIPVIQAEINILE